MSQDSLNSPEEAKKTVGSYRISSAARELLHCPSCHGRLKENDQQLVCGTSECGGHYPVLNGVPILLNEKNSVFSVSDLVSQGERYFLKSNQGFLKKFLRRFLPTISKNVKGRENYQRFSDWLLKRSDVSRILVIGGQILGQGMDSLAHAPHIEMIESDVFFGPRTALICDAHDLPFQDRSFDGVIIQAVLEHVVDPYRCCEEIYRVLKDDGIVYAETPFMQQVHEGRYDFTRFTHLGHRRLFRKFEEIDSGATCGPGMALAWAYQHFLLSFFMSRAMRAAGIVFASLTAFWFKYFDYFLINKPSALGAASGMYFMGKKTMKVLSDRDLIKGYRGV